MNIILADDHQTILTALKAMIVDTLSDKSFEIVECISCEMTFNAIENALSQNKSFDLAFLDYSMPSYTEQNMHTGGDLALHIKKSMPYCKVIIMTGVINGITVFEITQKVKPNGFIFKSDLDNDNFSMLLKDVLNGKTYKSNGVQEMYRQGLETNVLLEEYNRKILYYISIGYKIKEISETMGLSDATINKRIAKIKKAFNIDDTMTLLREAKKRGYV